MPAPPPADDPPSIAETTEAGTVSSAANSETPPRGHAPRQYDVIVVGARCAGSPLAMLLARRGHRVLLVDRAKFPSDTMSTHYIQFGGVSLLRRWGLEQRVAATNCPAVTRMSIDFGPFSLAARPRAADGTDVGYAPRRRVLDQLLVEAALEAGAEFRDGFAVEALTGGERVTGVVGRTATGGRVTERATVVVGADGLSSTVAKLVGAPVRIDRGTLACAYYTYWSGVPTSTWEGYIRDRCAFGVFPTNDGLTCVPVAWQRSMFDEVRRDHEAAYLAAVARAPEVADRLSAGRREERFVGTGRLPNQFRRSTGPGWALLGDAGHHKDPGTARGITDAFTHAELLAAALHEGLTGARPLDEALAGYEAARDTDAMPFFEFNCGLAALEPPDARTGELLGALRGDQAATDQFLGLIAATGRAEDFFAPDHLQHVLAGRAA